MNEFAYGLLIGNAIALVILITRLQSKIDILDERIRELKNIVMKLEKYEE